MKKQELKKRVEIFNYLLNNWTYKNDSKIMHARNEIQKCINEMEKTIYKK